MKRVEGKKTLKVLVFLFCFMDSTDQILLFKIFADQHHQYHLRTCKNVDFWAPCIFIGSESAFQQIPIMFVKF